MMLAVAAPANAGPLEDGLAAYQRGDYATALEIWIPFAGQGDAGAQHNLGYMYANGEGAPQDYAEAAKWYRKAAEQGVATAQWRLGSIYRGAPPGVPRDYGEAVKWFRMAAEQGHASAQVALGVGYHEGQGVPQDDAEASKWYRRAAEQGNASAQYNLGLMYHSGGGVPQDNAEATNLYRLAAAQGHTGAQLKLDLLEGGLTFWLSASLAQLGAPIAIVVGLIGGWCLKSWSWLLGIIIGIVVTLQLLFYFTIETIPFDLALFLIGIPPVVVWALLGRGARIWWKRRQAAFSSTPQ
jgi:TPR repeat protein